MSLNEYADLVFTWAGYAVLSVGALALTIVGIAFVCGALLLILVGLFSA